MSTRKNNTTNRTHSSTWLFILGFLWLLLAGSVLTYQTIQPGVIQITWNTETEIETAGFHLYRSQSPDGDFVQVTDRMILAKGDALSGASYTFIDEEVKPGQTYYYLVEEIEKNAAVNRYEDDISSYTVPRTAWWAVLLTAVSLVAGLGLIVMGIRDRNQ